MSAEPLPTHPDVASLDLARQQQPNAAAEASGTRSKVKLRSTKGESGSKLWVLLAIVVGLGALATPFVYKRWRDGQRPKGVKKLDAKGLYRGVLHPKQGASDEAWLVFFHYPGCGSCRRLRPSFEALAKTVNASEVLRFGAVDCREHAVACEKAGAEDFPKVRLYQTTWTSRTTAGVEAAVKGGDEGANREVVAEYDGPLVGYALVDWVKDLVDRGKLDTRDAAGNTVRPSIAWPSDDTLAKGMLEYKAIGTSQVLGYMKAKPFKRQGGFLLDADSAMRHALNDSAAAFPEEKNGRVDAGRMAALSGWVSALASTLPQTAERNQVAGFAHRIENHKEGWLASENPREAYLEALADAGLERKDRWEWCKPGSTPEQGVGGVSCGLWLLFHTMMANTSPREADVPTLAAIAAWIKAFYTCRDCSDHFVAIWDEKDEDGRTGAAAATAGHEEAALWLWRAHNKVNARITKKRGAAMAKRQWPPVQVCEKCYEPSYANGTMPITAEQWSSDQWRPSHVYGFLQQMFCYLSDTFVCANFFDPSGYLKR